MKRTLCLLLYMGIFAAFSFAAVPAAPNDDPEEWGWSDSNISFDENKVSIKVVVDESFKELRFNCADDAKIMSMREFCNMAYSNVGNKEILLLDVFSDTKLPHGPIGIDRDYFKINILPSLIDLGYKRIILCAGGFGYDTDADPAAKSRIAYVKNIKNLSWIPRKRYEEKFEKYSISAPKSDSGDVLERCGRMSFDKLKELGEAGDEWALYFYATSRIRHPLGRYNIEKGYPFNAEEGISILKKLSGKGMYAAAEELAMFYGLKGEYEYDKTYIQNRDDALAFEYMKTAHLLGSRIFICSLIKSACENGDWMLADALAENSASEVQDSEDCDYEEARKNGRKECALAIVKSVSKNEKDWPSPMFICTCYEDSLFPYFGSGFEVKNPLLYRKWAAVLAEEDPYSDNVMFFVHTLANGIGGPADLYKAFYAARMASIKPFPGNNAVIAYTAYAYEKGLGIAKNEARANMYWNKCFHNTGHESGRRIAYAASCLYNGFGFPKDKAKALEIMEKYVEIVERRMEDSEKNSVIINSAISAEPCLDELIKIYSGNFAAEDKNVEKARFYAAKAEEFKKRAKDADDAENNK